MMELVLDFSPEGTVEGMHMDTFDLGFLGAKDIVRATEIKFDKDTQLWGLHLPIAAMKAIDDEPHYAPLESAQGFKSYEQARKFEVSWLNICRHNGQPADGAWAKHAMEAARQVFGDDNPPSVEQFQSHRG